jgi:hypothetical protein
MLQVQSKDLLGPTFLAIGVFSAEEIQKLKILLDVWKQIGVVRHRIPGAERKGVINAPQDIPLRIIQNIEHNPPLLNEL